MIDEIWKIHSFDDSEDLYSLTFLLDLKICDFEDL